MIWCYYSSLDDLVLGRTIRNSISQEFYVGAVVNCLYLTRPSSKTRQFLARERKCCLTLIMLNSCRSNLMWPEKNRYVVSFKDWMLGTDRLSTDQSDRKGWMCEIRNWSNFMIILCSIWSLLSSLYHPLSLWGCNC